MQQVARVVLALEADDVAEEVMHFLDRTGSARVVGTAADDRQLIEAVRQLEPDAIVAQPTLIGPTAARGPTVLALDTRESIASLRAHDLLTKWYADHPGRKKAAEALWAENRRRTKDGRLSEYS